MAFHSAICTVSLGRAAHHSLPNKLHQAATHGFQGIELFAEDLWTYAEHLENEHGNSNEKGDQGRNGASNSQQVSHRSLLSAAAEVQRLCQEYNLTIVCLQPMFNYEGHIKRDQQSTQLHERAPLWFSLVKALRTDLIQVPSSYKHASHLTDDFKTIVADIRDLADSAAKQNPPIRIMYEALAWGTRVDTWQQSWNVAKSVDRWNCGICLDTFNIAARVYADPTKFPSGTNGDVEPDEARKTVVDCVNRLLTEIPVEKIFLLEVADGERLDAPLVKGHQFWNDEQPPRMSWSRNCRLFYGESDRAAFLPIKEIMQMFIGCRSGPPRDGVEDCGRSASSKQEPNGIGYTGWISQEVFSRSLWETQEHVPNEHALRAQHAWQKLLADISCCCDERP